MKLLLRKTWVEALILFGLLFAGQFLCLLQIKSTFDLIGAQEYYKNLIHIGLGSLVFPTLILLLIANKSKLGWVSILISLYWIFLILNSLYFDYFERLPTYSLMIGRLYEVPFVAKQAVVQIWSISESFFLLSALITLYITRRLIISSSISLGDFIELGRFKLRLDLICFIVLVTAFFRIAVQYSKASFEEALAYDVVQTVKRYGWFSFHAYSIWNDEIKVRKFVRFPGRINLPKDVTNEELSLGLLNVIMIQVESLDSKAMDLMDGDDYLLKNLRMLRGESIYLEHFFAQHQSGNSQDAELSSLYSILPHNEYPGFARLMFNRLESLVGLLKDNGYQSMVMHSNDGLFFNREKAMLKSGFDRMLDADDFRGKGSGWYSIDREFLKQSMVAIEQMESPFLAYLITMQSHGPFGNVSEISGDVAPDYEGINRNYLRSIYEFDIGLGDVIERMKKTGLWDNTILVLYADHESNLEYWADGYKYEKAEYNDHVPCLIRFPGCRPRVIKEAASHLDIAPTIAKLIGIDPSSTWLGSSLLGDIGNRLVILNRSAPVSIEYDEDQDKLLVNPVGLLGKEAIDWSEYMQSN